MIYVIAFFLLAGIVMCGMGFFEAQHEAPETAEEKLTRLRTRKVDITPEEVAQREISKEFARREEERVRGGRRTTFLPSLSRFISNNELLTRLEQDLLQVHSQWRASELLAASAVLALVVFIVLSFLGAVWWIALPLALFALAMPWGYVKFQRARYYRRFDEQLSDTLMLMSNSLRAGFSFLQSMEMVARESNPPVSNEFQRVTQEIAVGVPIQQSLTNLSDRIRSMDLNLVVTAVLIQREVGGGLAEILETISSVIRERMRIKREIRTLTTQGRLTGAILAAMPISLGLAIHVIGRMSSPKEPSFIEPLFSSDFGRIMLIGALLWQLIGFGLIWRIVSIRV